MLLADNVGSEGIMDAAAASTSVTTAPVIDAVAASAASSSGDSGPSLLETAGNMFQTIGIVVTGLIGVFLALTYLYAGFIIPAAAKQLEQEAQELAPDLLAEYLDKLDDGQTLAQRPDLMQELGQKITPLIEQKATRLQQERQPSGGVGRNKR